MSTHATEDRYYGFTSDDLTVPSVMGNGDLIREDVAEWVHARIKDHLTDNRGTVSLVSSESDYLSNVDIALHESNVEAIADHLSSLESGDWMQDDHDQWTDFRAVPWQDDDETIPTRAAVALYDVMLAMREYPVLDESAMGERECELFNEELDETIDRILSDDNTFDGMGDDRLERIKTAFLTEEWAWDEHSMSLMELIATDEMHADEDEVRNGLIICAKRAA